ncbi:alpha/beta fold hydrolase [Agreia pratensis]|uniref:alpha/beta fold hydrolase n=1 Tax=Agreia pratensis TaxID=150121 RepID=UPI001FD120DB|nr:alpha/beta hydrolase [Agreia pratensis]
MTPLDALDELGLEDVGIVTPPAAWLTDAPPTLVVGGDQDLLTGVQPVRPYAAALDAELSFIADCGHYPWIEQPAAFRRMLDAWLAEQGRATRG